MSRFFKSNTLGIIANKVINQMFEAQFDVVSIPPIKSMNPFKNQENPTLLIEMKIYEEDHPWFNIDLDEYIDFYKKHGVEIIFLTNDGQALPTKYKEFKTIKIRNGISHFKLANNVLTTPLLVNERLYNPENTKFNNRVCLFKFDHQDLPEIMITFDKKFNSKFNVYSVGRITSGLIESLTEVIKKSDVFIIYDDKKIDRQLLNFLQIIAVLQNTIVIVKSDIEEQFKYSIKSEGDFKDHLLLEAYLSNEILIEKYNIPNMREVFLNHTFINKISFKDLIIGEDMVHHSTVPGISAIVSTMRKENVVGLINQLNNQIGINLEIIMLTHGFELTESEIKNINKTSKVRIDIISEKITIPFGECLNKCLALVNEQQVIKIDDDDYYFPNYILDLWIALEYSQYSIVGKNAFYFYLEKENLVGRRRLEKQYKIVSEVKGNSIMSKTSTLIDFKFGSLSRHVDSDLFQRIRNENEEIYCIHPYDMCVYRAANKESHTFQAIDGRFLFDAEIMYYGLPNETVST